MLATIHKGIKSITKKSKSSTQQWGQEKEHPNFKDTLINRHNHPSNIYYPLSSLVAHHTTMVESPSTKRLERLKVFTYNNPSKKARISMSMAKPWHVGLESTLIIVPKWSLNTPPIPNHPGFAKEPWSNFNLIEPIGGGNLFP